MFARKLQRNAQRRTYFNDIKAMSDTVVDVSMDTALDNAIKVIKLTEQKIRLEKLNYTEISVGINIGVISLNISRKIE
jgi:hypothetical protein